MAHLVEAGVNEFGVGLGAFWTRRRSALGRRWRIGAGRGNRQRQCAHRFRRSPPGRGPVAAVTAEVAERHGSDRGRPATRRHFPAPVPQWKVSDPEEFSVRRPPTPSGSDESPTWSRRTAAPPVSRTVPDWTNAAPCPSAGTGVSVQVYEPLGSSPPVVSRPFHVVAIEYAAGPSLRVATTRPVALTLWGILGFPGAAA